MINLFSVVEELIRNKMNNRKLSMLPNNLIKQNSKYPKKIRCHLKINLSLRKLGWKYSISYNHLRKILKISQM